MQAAVAGLTRVLDVAAEVRASVSRVDRALPAVRRLFETAGAEYKLVGGLAVVHHGYVRTTEDVDILVDRDASRRLDDLLQEHGFERLSPSRLRHLESGVVVDLLLAGDPMPRPGGPPYPSPASLAGSVDDPTVVGLSGLLELKLGAARHQDLADVVALLKRLDEGEYLRAEAAVPAGMRAQLATLRRDALEELSWEGGAGP
jgi:hypothetical protein